MRTKCGVGMFTKKRGVSSPASSKQHYNSNSNMNHYDELERSLGPYDSDYPYQIGMIRNKKEERAISGGNRVGLQRQNMKLRAQLMEKELSQRQYIQRIMQLQHEVISISSRLTEMQKIISDRRGNLERTRSQNIKPNISILEGLSLIQPQTTPLKRDITVSLATATSNEQLRQYNKIAQIVSKKTGLKDTRDIYDYVKTCVKFTETVRNSICDIFPIYENNNNRTVKVVWKKLKTIISQWLNKAPRSKHRSPGQYLRTAYV